MNQPRNNDIWIIAALIACSAATVAIILAWIINRDIPPTLIVLTLTALGAAVIAYTLDHE